MLKLQGPLVLVHHHALLKYLNRAGTYNFIAQYIKSLLFLTCSNEAKLFTFYVHSYKVWLLNSQIVSHNSHKVPLLHSSELKSRLCHCNTLFLFIFRHSVVDLLLCLESLSYCMTQVIHMVPHLTLDGFGIQRGTRLT